MPKRKTTASKASAKKPAKKVAKTGKPRIVIEACKS